jgi:hypothetical protein
MSQELLNDLYSVWGTDLSAGNSGDLMSVSGTERGKQRLLRRYMTNPGDYIFEPGYGAGLGRYVGEVQSKAELDEIYGLIMSQTLMESVVAPSPAPVITLAQLQDLSLWCSVQYTDAAEQVPVTLSFTVGND